MALRREKRHRDPPYSFTLSRKQQKTKELHDNKEVEMKKIKIQKVTRSRYANTKQSKI